MYAGNLANLKDIEKAPNYEFVKMDICDFDAFYKLMLEKKVEWMAVISMTARSWKSLDLCIRGLERSNGISTWLNCLRGRLIES